MKRLEEANRMTTAAVNRSHAIDNSPHDAPLGSLCFFSVSQADVHLENAHRELKNLGLSPELMRQKLHPRDAFAKAANRFGKKWPPRDGVRSELMVRKVGEERGAELFRYLILERLTVAGGQKKRVAYDKVGELRFDKGRHERGRYVGAGVEHIRTDLHADGTSALQFPLNEEEDRWLTEQLATFADHYDHLLRFMDSHAVRSFVREFIYSLSGICVRESGGLYFVRQEHAEDIAKLGQWVKSIGSAFHAVPLVDSVDQREMIREAFELETIRDIDSLEAEVEKIKADPIRKIEEKTFNSFLRRAVEMAEKMKEYNQMLDARTESAESRIRQYQERVLTLVTRVKPNARAS